MRLSLIVALSVCLLSTNGAYAFDLLDFLAPKPTTLDPTSDLLIYNNNHDLTSGKSGTLAKYVGCPKTMNLQTYNQEAAGCVHGRALDLAKSGGNTKSYGDDSSISIAGKNSDGSFSANVTDEEGNSRYNTYDSDGNETSSTEGLGVVTTTSGDTGTWGDAYSEGGILGGSSDP